FDVTTAPSELDLSRPAGDRNGVLIFRDLGAGTQLGTKTVSAADNGTNGTTVSVPLSAAGIAALNAARGGTLALRGALTRREAPPGGRGAPGGVALHRGRPGPGPARGRRGPRRGLVLGPPARRPDEPAGRHQHPGRRAGRVRQLAEPEGRGVQRLRQRPARGR